jgi:lipooligosaccharide transport system permease protein
MLPLALRPLSYFWAQFARTWKADVSTTFLAPVLYLASLGAGLGSLVGHGRALASLGGQSYLSFVAPALLAATAMQVAVARSTYEVWGYCSPWNGAYRNMAASPIGIQGIVLGQLAWIAARVSLSGAFYLAVSAAFGTVHSPYACATVLVVPLVGLAFGAPIAAWAVTARHEQPFTLVFRLFMLPLFLFSGTFFPISQLPAALRWAAYALPLWHGVELSRDLYDGAFHPALDLVHFAYLATLAVLGALAARVTYRRRLAK